MVRTFTEEFKLNAVILVLEEGMKANKVAQDLGIKPTTLYTRISRVRSRQSNL